jgi:hypothetical protein
MKQILLITILAMLSTLVIGQNRTLKGDGQIFWEEHFDWADESSPTGWSLPEGWSIEDNSWDDTGFVWTWTKDSLQGPFSKRDGGYILNSTTRSNGFLSIDMDFHNAYVSYPEMLYVNSSIILPKMDFSTHPSVIMELEQLFKYLNAPRMVIEVSNDDGAHWAEFDMKMDTKGGVNTQNLKNNEVALYSANLSEVAAGQPNVTIKITWDGSILYFWMLDDISFREGWDYDLKMTHWNVQLQDENSDGDAGFFYMMPKTQILPFGDFEAGVLNYGDVDLNHVHFNVNIKKNGVEQFNASSDNIRYLFFGDPIDTLDIEEIYTPVDYGHYEITFGMYSDEEEQNPENNIKSYFFHVTDSVFARTPDVNEADQSPWKNLYQYPHEGDYMGVEFDPIADCEASSISVYLAKANLNADFKVALLEIEPGEEGTDNIVELLSSEIVRVEPEILGTWVTLPLEPDGQSEFMKAGSRYIAAVQFWTYIAEDDLINRGDAFWIGSTQSYPGSEDKQWLYQAYEGVWSQGSEFNNMIRLNINNHDNIIDGAHNLAKSMRLNQNYPNPFVGSTSIDYSMDIFSTVSLEIKDINGRVVRQFDLGDRSPGTYSYPLNCQDLKAGVYTYSLISKQGTVTRKMLIRK